MSAESSRLAWLFVDLDSFFASVEQHCDTELQGWPVGVIPVQSEGTCVIAASREAKAHGVKTGTGVREARRMCPGIRLIVARPAFYVQVHNAIAGSLEKCSPLHKAYSIDEWAIRLRGPDREPGAAMDLARQIQSQLLRDFSRHLTCSIGIAPTRLLAKIASDIEKPNGVVMLQMKDLPGRLEHVPLEDLTGIGPGMRVRLKQDGISDVKGLWAMSRAEAIKAWGSVAGAHWWAGFHGYDEPELPTRRHSMSHASVLEPRFRNEAGARGILTRLVCRLGTRLRTDGFVATALSINGSDFNGGHLSASLELPHVQDTPTLLEAFYTLWERRTALRAGPIRMVGASVSGLVPADQVSGNLFEKADRPVRLSKAMDTITRRFGLSSLYVGAMHGHRHHMDDKIAFGRIPPG